MPASLENPEDLKIQNVFEDWESQILFNRIEYSTITSRISGMGRDIHSGNADIIE